MIGLQPLHKCYFSANLPHFRVALQRPIATQHQTGTGRLRTSFGRPCSRISHPPLNLVLPSHPTARVVRINP